MNRNVLPIIFQLVLCTNFSFSQAPTIDWIKNYGGEDIDGVLCMQQTNDGGYVFCGYTRSTSGDVSGNYGLNDCWVVKLNAARAIEWQKCLGGSLSETGVRIHQTTDGGYVVGAMTNSFNNGVVGTSHGQQDYWIVKLDNAGTIVWQRAYGGSLMDMFHDIRQTADGGYIVCGESESLNGDITAPHGSWDAWLLKLDASGNIVWQKSIGGTNGDVARSIRQTADGGYIFAGSSASTDGDITIANANGTWIVKLDAAGNIQWQKAYGSGASGDYPNEIEQTSDGGYAVLATCNQNAGDVTGNHGQQDCWFFKLDNIGNLSWQKSLGGSDYEFPIRMLIADDGGYIITGSTYSNDGDVTGNHGSADGWVVKISSTGLLKWQKTIGGTEYDDLSTLCLTSDHALLLAGATRSNNSGDMGTNLGAPGTDDVFIVKLSFNVLPVELNNLTAVGYGQDVICNWTTMQENNSSHFIIERSDDALHFHSVGNVAAAGNSTMPLRYQFTDQGILASDKKYLYYRLKMTDSDGQFTISETVKIKVTYSPLISIYPNPVVEFLNISFNSSAMGKTTLDIFNTAGIKVIQQTVTVVKGYNNFPLDVHMLPAGQYILLVGGQVNKKQPFSKVNK